MTKAIIKRIATYNYSIAGNTIHFRQSWPERGDAMQESICNKNTQL